MAVRAPNHTAPTEHTICSSVTASIQPPVDMMYPVSPRAIPLSMMSALSRGRYSEAMVLTSCSPPTARSGPR
jgi:hypothetical protein